MSERNCLALLETSPNEQRRTTSTENLISSFGTGTSSSRNAQLALLKLYATKIAVGEDFHDQLLSSCWEYFTDFSTKVACFHDLQPYVSSLESSKQEKLIVLCGDIARDIRPHSESSEVSGSSESSDPLLKTVHSQKRFCGSHQRLTC